ncbi:MAG: protein kinase [Acidobacteriaceae bacterium]
MTLTTGARLGHFEIAALIGAGGMGEVYKARDTRLGRDVAIKVLPASLAADPERLRRFEQEARAVAALNHPNILAVHDIGQHEGCPFLVSELLEGESLRDVLARGPLTPRKAIAYAVQIAQGLAAAHARDIVHRDLKPENLFVTREGRIKILDFGLAKVVPKRVSVDATMTVAHLATEAGMVLGTVGYMSPEQVRGEALDSRTDIFSFGAVLYEMLTGQRAFKRDTAAETMTAILKEDPPEFTAAPGAIPPALERTVRHCLEKSPDHRFQSARDLAFDLESLSTLTSASNSLAASPSSRPILRNTAIAAAGLLGVALLAGWLVTSLHRPAQGSQFHQITFRTGALDNARYMPDGRTIIYTATWQGAQPQIYSVPADGSNGRPLGIENARLLAVSRQGTIAVALAPHTVSTLVHPGTLARVVSDGAPKPEIDDVQAADFTPDGSALAIVRYVPDKIACQVEYPIGKVLYSEQGIGDLRFSPNGKYLAFATHTNFTDDRGNVVILRSTGEQVAVSPLVESLQGLAWSPSGDEVWYTSPLESGEIHAMNLSGKVRTPLSVPGRLFLRDISPTGQLLANQGITRRGIIVATEDGKTQRDLAWLSYSFLRDLSPDGKLILFEEEGASSAAYTVFVRGTDGSAAIPIGEGYGLALSPDMQWALADKLGDKVNEVWLLPVGAGEPRRLSPPNLAPGIGAGFLPSGNQVIYIARESGRPMRTWIQDLKGGPPRSLTPEGVAGFVVSPDGQWMIAGDRQNVEVGTPTVLVPLAGGPIQPIKGLAPHELPLSWTADGQLYVASRLVEGVAHVDKLNPHTGARTPWRDIPLPTTSGSDTSWIDITPDGHTWALEYRLMLSDLYTVSGSN